MGFDQYHEPPEELSQETRTFARMITSLIEEAEAISWYEQRISVEKDKNAKAIMANAQKEEFKHFGMNLEFLLRKKPDWRAELQGILFTKGDIVKLGEKAEKKVDQTNAVSVLGYHERRKVFRAGIISFGDAAISCTVRSLSSTGALLEIRGPAGVPKKFTLVIAADEFRRACRVIWMTEKRLGVVFEPI